MSFEAFRTWANRWFGIVGGVILICGAMFAGIKYIVTAETSGMGRDVQNLTTLFGPIPDGISSLRERTAKLETLMDIKSATAQPTSTRHAKAVENALTTAKNQNVRLKPESIEDPGAAFLTAGRSNPVAWQAALKFLEYRTWLNSDIAPIGTKQSRKTDYRYALQSRPNPDNPGSMPVQVFTVTEIVGPVQMEDSARMELLSQPQEKASGVRYLIVEGSPFEIMGLDGQLFKNVIIKNAIVEYDGGPIKLENVYFVNCILRWRQTNRAVDLGKTLLASTAVTFPSGS